MVKLYSPVKGQWTISPARETLSTNKVLIVIRFYSSRYSIDSMHAALGRRISKLVLIDGVKVEDFSSEYRCHAENIYGAANASLIVQGMIYVRLLTNQMRPAFISRVIIPCFYVSESPKPLANNGKPKFVRNSSPSLSETSSLTLLTLYALSLLISVY